MGIWRGVGRFPPAGRFLKQHQYLRAAALRLVGDVRGHDLCDRAHLKQHKQSFLRGVSLSCVMWRVKSGSLDEGQEIKEGGPGLAFPGKKNRYAPETGLLMLL